MFIITYVIQGVTFTSTPVEPYSCLKLLKYFDDNLIRYTITENGIKVYKVHRNGEIFFEY